MKLGLLLLYHCAGSGWVGEEIVIVTVYGVCEEVSEGAAVFCAAGAGVGAGALEGAADPPSV